MTGQLAKKKPTIRILTIREQKVVHDADLAAIYGVTTKRFPQDFAFHLTAEEAAALRSRNATGSRPSGSMRSQSATASKRNIRYLPWAFTEHGALQVANRFGVA